MNPNSPKELARLREAMDWSVRKLRPFRVNRTEAIKQYVGRNYSDDSSAQKMPINMMHLAVSIYQRYLSPPAMKCLVRTPIQKLKTTAYELELAIDHLMSEINYAGSHRDVVVDAMFGMGIIKVGLEVKEVAGEFGYLHDAGQPFADPVDLDNFVQDMSATRPDQVAFEGDKYRIPYEWVMDQKQTYTKAGREGLSPTGSERSSRDGGGSRAESLSRGSDVMVSDYEPMVELWDLWLPRENLFVVLPVDGTGPPLMVKEWEGPEHGMYHKLGFNWVPSNLMPLAPVANWVDLNDLVNRIWRKLGRQAEREKTILGVQGAASMDAKHVVNASDGEVISMQNPESMREIRYGGIDNQSLGFAINIKDTLVYLMGNIEALGGFAAQSGTFGQDRLLAESANKMIDDMQQTVAHFNKRVIKDLAMYMWEDPHITLPLVKRIEGTSIEIPFQWTPESREGDFSEYNIIFEPYVLRSTTPTERIHQLNQVMSQVIMPGMELFAQQGVQVDMRKYLKSIAKYSNLEELNDILLPVEEGRDPVEPYSGYSVKTPSSRVYEHVNVAGGPSQAAKSFQLQQAALAGGGQQQPAGPGQGPGQGA